MNVLKYPFDDHRLHHRNYKNGDGEIRSTVAFAGEMISSNDPATEEPEASASLAASKSPSVFHYKTKNPYVEERTICSKTKKAVVVRTVMAGVLPEDYKPSDIDVICGRGKTFHAHAGNRNFVKIIHENAWRYQAAKNRFDKSTVVASVLATLLDKGVKFVKQDKTDKRYYQMSKDQAHEKCGHAIRDFIKNNQVSCNLAPPASIANVVPDMTGSDSCNGSSSSRRGSTTSVNSMSTMSSVGSSKSSSSSLKRKSIKAKKEASWLVASKATAKAIVNMKATSYTPVTNTFMGMMQFHHSSSLAPSSSVATTQEQAQARTSAIHNATSGSCTGGGWSLVDMMTGSYNHTPTPTVCGFPTSNNPMVVGRHRSMMATSMFPTSMPAVWSDPVHQEPVIFSSSGTIMSRRHTQDGSTNAKSNEILPETYRSTSDLLSDALKVQDTMTTVSDNGSCCRDETNITDGCETSLSSSLSGFHGAEAMTTMTKTRSTIYSESNGIHIDEGEELEDDDHYDDMFMPYPVASSDPEIFEHRVSEMLANGRNNSINDNETSEPNDNSMTFENFLDPDMCSHFDDIQEEIIL